MRTKLRIQNQREEPIDFISKVVLMIFGLIPMDPISFLSQEFRQSYLIYAALSIEQLEQMISDMEDYRAIK